MTTAMNSATIKESQIPSMPKISGKLKTATTWKTKVLKKEITADVTPSLRAVKKLEL